MKKCEFDQLKVGDTVIVSVGRDKGTRAQVRYIEDGYALVKAFDDDYFVACNHSRTLELFSFRALSLAN